MSKLYARTDLASKEKFMCDKYADEEIADCTETYPPEYTGPGPVVDQIEALAGTFNLDPRQALEYAKHLPELPEGAEHWFAVPTVDGLAKGRHFTGIGDKKERYCRAVRIVDREIATSRFLECPDHLATNSTPGMLRGWYHNRWWDWITREHLRVSDRTARALVLLTESQPGDILLIPAQLGMRHRGRSVRRARAVFTPQEYELTALMGAAIVLANPARLIGKEILAMSCSGDEVGYPGNWLSAPFFAASCIGVEFDTYGTDYAGYSAASAFLPEGMTL